MINAHLLNELAALNGDSDISDPPNRKGLWVHAFSMSTVPSGPLTSTHGIQKYSQKAGKVRGKKEGIDKTRRYLAIQLCISAFRVELASMRSYYPALQTLQPSRVQQPM